MSRSSRGSRKATIKRANKLLGSLASTAGKLREIVREIRDKLPVGLSSAVMYDVQVLSALAAWAEHDYGDEFTFDVLLTFRGNSNPMTITVPACALWTEGWRKGRSDADIKCVWNHAEKPLTRETPEAIL